MGNSPLFFRFNNIVSAKWADYFNGDCLGFVVIDKPARISEDFPKTGLGKKFNPPYNY